MKPFLLLLLALWSLIEAQCPQPRYSCPAHDDSCPIERPLQ
jgi:hypothetical protein